MNITLYRTTTCPKCHILELKLRDKNVNFTECTDVSEMQRLGITQVPVLSVDGVLMPFTEANTWVNNYIK